MSNGRTPSFIHYNYGHRARRVLPPLSYEERRVYGVTLYLKKKISRVVLVVEYLINELIQGVESWVAFHNLVKFIEGHQREEYMYALKDVQQLPLHITLHVALCILTSSFFGSNRACRIEPTHTEYTNIHHEEPQLFYIKSCLCPA